MKLEMNSSNRSIVGVVVLVVLAGVFWTQLLSPKRDEVKKLDAQVEQVKTSLAQHESEIVEAEAARKEFPVDYQRLVVVGKAVPGDDETASLLVQMNRIADSAGGTFSNIKLSASSGGEEAAAPVAGAGEQPASPTEVAASLLPLGATVGTAGLAVMPYTVTFDGDFFQVADFIKGLDSLVKTKGSSVVVDGRLVTIDGFSLASAPNSGFPALQGSFALTTYLTPPEAEAATGEAAPEAPEAGEATPAAETIGAGQ
jgi:Tfp pilus assembly protein PilO